MHYLTKNIRIILLLVLLTSAIYANVFNAPFHFDDLSFLLENPQVRSFLNLFTTDPGTDTRKILTLFTFAINFQINPYTPLLYRLVNIFFHLMTAFLLAGALRYLFQAPFFREKNILDLDHLAWGAAFIFCVHPLQTDSVTYIWQRSEVLSGFFYALILMCYWRGRIKKNWRFIIYASGFFFTGLYVKGSVMTAPILIGLSEVMFFGAGKRIVKNMGAFFLAAISLIVCAVILDDVLFQVNFSVDWRYFYTQCLVIWKYLQLTVLPVGQSVDHGFVWGKSLWNPAVFLGFSGLLAIFAAIVRWSLKYRIACFGAAWFFIYLLPTSSVIPLLTPIFEHRLYFSLAGFGLMTSVIIWHLSAGDRKRYWIVLSVIILAFSITTVLRNQVWRTRPGLMEDAVRKSPDYVRPYFTLGSYYISESRFSEAEQMFRKCIALNPYFADAYNNVGTILERRGRQQEA
ncbi:MAG: tetratricopeptide repeat protein, partial [Victivallaceae bacterium]|nr:tetratricopeptide repeat protein [Victivallaceae bacterium]